IFLYDVTSSYVEGEQNELAEYGLNRDEIKGKKQIIIGLVTDVQGEPLSVEVFPGNTNDHKTVVNQLEKIKKVYGTERVVFVGDRGMIKSKQIKEITDAPNHWNYITAITKSQIEKMLKEDVLQLGLFDESLCEVENEGIRYILRKNPWRAKEIKINLEKRIAFIEKKVVERNKYLSEHPKAKSATACRYLEGEIRRRNLDKVLGLTEYEDRR
ncbi:MAG: transposase, partial [bacterium]|nr:transposase [bacterium]